MLLLVIGVAVTEEAVGGDRQAAAASRHAGYVNGIYAAAEAAAGSGSSTDVIGAPFMSGSQPIAFQPGLVSRETRRPSDRGRPGTPGPQARPRPRRVPATGD